MKVTRCNNGEKCDDCNLAADIIINTYAGSALLTLTWKEDN